MKSFTIRALADKKKISLIALFAALVMSVNATDIWTGSKHVSWDDGPVQIAAEQFTGAQPGNLLKVHFTGAKDGIEFKVMKEGLPHLPGSCKGAWINGDGVYEQFLSAAAIEDLTNNGLEIIGADFTCTQVELLDGRTPKEGVTVWMGYFWADNWNTMELWPEAYNSIDFSKIEAIRFYSEAGRTNYVLNFKLNWEEGGHIADKDHEITETAGDGYAELTLTDDMRAKIANAEQWLIQFYKGNEQEPFNFTEVVLVPKSDTIPEDAFWVGEKHISWADGGLQFPAEKFAEVVPGNLLRVHYTGATDGIEFKVMNANFDHLAGSREGLNFPNAEGSLEHFLTPKAVEELKAHGLELIGANFTVTEVELMDGKASLPEGVNVWTGYFWADEWTTLELYWNGYRYVDFNDVKAIRFYSEANRSDFVLNVRDNWDEDGGVEIANINAMTAGEGYMELPLTDDMREKIAASEHLLVQFNKEGGDPFNVTDIVLVMEEPYTRTVTNGNYGTICLSRAAATIEGATMYRIVGGNAFEGITIEEVASMEAGKPYIFQASADQITVTMTGPRAEVQEANGLVGNLGESAITVPQNGHSYVLSTNLLYLVNSDVTIAPNRAYIDMDAITPVAPAQGAKRRVIATYNQATGIEDASTTFVGPEKIFENGVLYILRDGVKYNATGARVQ